MCRCGAEQVYAQQRRPVVVDPGQTAGPATLNPSPCRSPFDLGVLARHVLAAQRPIHAAFSWLHANPKTIMDWQVELVAIPAPPHGEQARAEWLAARFAELVSAMSKSMPRKRLGILPAASCPPRAPGRSFCSRRTLTPFSRRHAARSGPRRRPPRSSGRLRQCRRRGRDAGLVIRASSRRCGTARCRSSVLGNVGEEGEGDLRGVRHFYEHSALAGRIAAHIVLDGAGADAAVTQALGSRRYQVAITGPGGHSFTDAGTPNPIAALASALAALAETPLPDEPRTTLNLGTIRGGISVNSIPESAQATVDFRSTDPISSLRLEVALHRAVEDAVDHWNERSKSAGAVRARGCLSRSPKSATAPPRKLPDDSAAAGHAARRRPPSWPAHRSPPRLDRRQHSALARRACPLDGRGRRRRRRAHAARVVFGQRPRARAQARAAAHPRHAGMGRGAMSLLSAPPHGANAALLPDSRV